MKLSRTAIGLSIRTAMEAASLTLRNLSESTGIPVSTLSRRETGQNDVTFEEMMLILPVVGLDVKKMQDLVESIEKSGVHQKKIETATTEKSLKSVCLENFSKLK